MREQQYAQKEQDFEDFLSGKKEAKKKGFEVNDDMSLQDIFKQFYSKAKTVKQKDQEGDGVFNSAKQSLTGFSARLEKRREAARKKKEEEQAASAKDQSTE